MADQIATRAAIEEANKFLNRIAPLAEEGKSSAALVEIAYQLTLLNGRFDTLGDTIKRMAFK